MDRFTRNYSIFLGLLALLLLGWWLSTLSFRVGELNDLLAADERLARYPYRFRVTAVEGDTATLTTPRSPEVPAVRFLALLKPGLAGRAPDDPELVAAQRELAELQGRARELIAGEPDIAQVRWEVDRRWYAEHGVELR